MASLGLETYLERRAERESERRERRGRLEQALQRRLRQSRRLAELTQRVLGGAELDDLVKDVCRATASALETDHCDVFELRPEAEELVLREGVGWPPDYIGEKTLDASEGTQPGRTAKTWQPTVVEDLDDDDRFPTPELLAEEGIRSGITVVVPGPDDPWGVFGVHDRQPRAFDDHDTAFVQSMSHVLSHAILRQRAQREIEREEERFESLVSEVDEYAIFTLDPDGYVRSWNQGAERIKGYTEQEILGTHFSAFYPEEDRESGRPRRNLERAAEQGSIQDEGWRVRKDGSRFWGNVTITALHDTDGEIRGFAKVTRDMTERRERERQLEASNERLEHFAYAASHDLQEPLRAVASYLQLIQRRHADSFDDEARDLFGEALDGVERMQEMIESLLAYARIHSEGRQPRPVDAEAILDDALSDLGVRIAETDADVSVGELPRVQADPDQLAQVFRNLLSNAIKYSGDEPPRIHIDAERAPGMWRFTVRDEGVGIPPEASDRIFDVFGRLGDGSEEAGTGIGLAICEQIVDRHGGEMGVDSEPGVGSTFHFTMPPAREGTIEPPDARRPQSSPSTRG